MALAITRNPTAAVRRHLSIHPDAITRLITLGLTNEPDDASIRSGNHAVAVAQKVRNTRSELVDEHAYRRIHLFMAAPAGLILQIAHRWHRVAPVTVYEDLSNARGYQASVHLPG